MASRMSDWVMDRALKPFAIAGFFVLVALLWTFPLQHVIAYPFVFLFFGAIMGSAWFGGITAGCIAVALSSILVTYFFVPPLFSMSVAKDSQSFLAAFIVCAIAITVVSSARKRAESAVRVARDQLEAKVQERTAQLERSNQEIRESERQLRAAQDDLARLSRTMSMAEMAASIAHELNQPLTAVVTHAQACRKWLSSDPPNLEKATATAEKIVRESTRASSVVQRVRALFQKDAQVREPVDMNQLIREMARLLRDEAARRGVTIRLQLGGDLPQLQIDPVQMQQVLLNLALNGMDAMADMHGLRELTIYSERHGDGEVQVAVEDCGGGIMPEVAGRIFEPFFSTKPQGTGMGLAICRSIVEAHDGRLTAVNRDDGGARLQFTVRTQAG